MLKEIGTKRNLWATQFVKTEKKSRKRGKKALLFSTFCFQKLRTTNKGVLLLATTFFVFFFERKQRIFPKIRNKQYDTTNYMMQNIQKQNTQKIKGLETLLLLLLLLFYVQTQKTQTADPVNIGRHT